MLSSSCCVEASTLLSMLASPFSRSFLDTYNLSTLSLRCNALCMVISLLVLWSICLSSSLVHFKNGPEYLTRSSAKVFISLIRFLLYILISSIFLALLRYPFLIFSCISTCLMGSVSNIPKYLYVSVIIIIIIIYCLRVFHISISWWFFTGVWVTASLLKSPGLFSVFWPFSVMLSFG